MKFDHSTVIVHDCARNVPKKNGANPLIRTVPVIQISLAYPATAAPVFAAICSWIFFIHS